MSRPPFRKCASRATRQQEPSAPARSLRKCVYDSCAPEDRHGRLGPVRGAGLGLPLSENMVQTRD